MKVALVIIALVVCSIIATEAELAKARRRLGYRAGRRGPEFRNVSAGRRMRRPKSWRDRVPTRNKAGRLTSSATKKGLAKRKRPEQDAKVKVTSDATNNNATKKNPPEKVGTETEQTTSMTEAATRGMPPGGGYGGDMGIMGHGMGMDPMMGGGMMGGGMGMGMGGTMFGGKMMTGLLGTMLASQVLGTLATTGSGIATTVLTAKLSQNSGSGTNSVSLGSETSGKTMGSSGIKMENGGTNSAKMADSGTKASNTGPGVPNADGESKSGGNETGPVKGSGSDGSAKTAVAAEKESGGGASLGGHTNKDIDVASPSV
uniref:Glycine rich superfamily member n=1 Tax=Rhipicephalus zambeziensis TaxID=60191 RepID=A0A224Z141_9ACAR